MLQSLGSPKPSRNSPLVCSNAASSVFGQIKTALPDFTMLPHSKPDAKLCLMLDASDVAVGAVFQQKIHNVW